MLIWINSLCYSNQRQMWVRNPGDDLTGFHFHAASQPKATRRTARFSYLQRGTFRFTLRDDPNDLRRAEALLNRLHCVLPSPQWFPEKAQRDEGRRLKIAARLRELETKGRAGLHRLGTRRSFALLLSHFPPLPLMFVSVVQSGETSWRVASTKTRRYWPTLSQLLTDPLLVSPEGCRGQRVHRNGFPMGRGRCWPPGPSMLRHSRKKNPAHTHVLQVLNQCWRPHKQRHVWTHRKAARKIRTCTYIYRWCVKAHPITAERW